jgi:hypothetical protein
MDAMCGASSSGFSVHADQDGPDDLYEADQIIQTEDEIDLRRIGHTTQFLDDSGDGTYSDTLYVIHDATGKLFSVYSNRGNYRVRPIGHTDIDLALQLVQAIQSPDDGAADFE